MVKHGRDKKRRAGRIGKTKLKNRTWTRYDPDPKVNAALKEHWDPSKTPSANLNNFGLLANPNHTGTTTSTSKVVDGANSLSVKKSTAVIELFDVPDSDGLYRDPNKVKQHPLTAEDEQYIIKCMNRYGTNYIKMFRDTTINNMQHTEEKLRKLGSRFLLLSPEQRHIPCHDMPDKVQQLLSPTQL